MTTKRKIYVIGDAGQDAFTGVWGLENLPSGVPFVRCVLEEVLGAYFHVVPLVKSVSDVGDDKRFLLQALERKEAQLQPYEKKNEEGNPNDRVKSTIETDKEARKVRISKYDIGEASRHASPRYCLVDEQLRFDQGDLLVAHHAGSAWSEQALARCQEWIETMLPEGSGAKSTPSSSSQMIRPGFPRVLVNLSSNLPAVNSRGGVGENGLPFESALWNTLYKKREHVGIVTCMSTLRKDGAVISRRLSFEQTVEDFCSELHRFPSLSYLGHFAHLFVRIGMIGIVHIENVVNNVHNCKFTGEICFSPYAKQGLHRNEDDGGFTIGRNTLLVAALARALVWAQEVGRNASVDEDIFRRAGERALWAMRTVDDTGYEHESGETAEHMVRKSVKSAQDVINIPWSELLVSSSANKGDLEDLPIYGLRSLPAHLLVPMPPRVVTTSQPWHILDDVLIEAPVHRINVAMAIVMAGHGKVLNRRWSSETRSESEFAQRIWELLTRVEYWNPEDRAPDFVTLQEGCEPVMPRSSDPKPRTTKPIIGGLDRSFGIDVPIMKFGSLNLIERDEIESLRSIANLLRLHRRQSGERLAQDKVPGPISIAVFGAPGTGKSFAVKQLATEVGSEEELPRLEFNVAQFSGMNDLNDALREVKDKIDLGKQKYLATPLVFFDEFDCALGDVELGWLKYFLSPMQDGKVKVRRGHQGYQQEYQQEKYEDIGPAIFVFAGGLHYKFGSFDPRTDSAYDNQRNSEEYQSRLKRFAGQKGPDFISRLRGHIDILPINDLPGHSKHFIRRAMQLRSFLVKNTLVEAKGPRAEEAKIDTAVVYALLTTDLFYHGVRSMQAIVEMCTPIHGRIEIASLPSRVQLGMHVDATEFMTRVHRGRVRKRAEYLWPGR